MAQDVREITRPQRWAVPFDAEMTDADVARVVALPLFARMDAKKFPARMPLDGIVRNDCALRSYSDRQLVVRQGDYGSSAFLIVSGEVKVYLEGDIPEEELGHDHEHPKNLLTQVWRNLFPPPERAPKHLLAVSSGDATVAGSSTVNVFFQDLPAVGKRGGPPPVMGPGTVFGEMSALGRTPRSATVVATGSCELLEIRWQGLRDLRSSDKGFKEYVDGIYRERSLTSDHFQTSPLFAPLGETGIEVLRHAAIFESHGSFEWSGQYKKGRQERRQKRTAAPSNEPEICGQTQSAESVYLVRAGFARVSHRVGVGEVTSRYISRGDLFGIEALHAYIKGNRAPIYGSTLRALGYIDVIKLPLALVARAVESSSAAAAWLAQGNSELLHEQDRAHLAPLKGEMMEFGTESRVYNGTSIMAIDLERCTRCDDCVRGCSNAHNGQPRFVRHGEVNQGFLFPNACMHCQDPVCMIGCPTGAISRTKDGGQVVVNDQTCIGCSTCANSCPYDNIRMVERSHYGEKLVDQKGNAVLRASKCDLCYDQVGGPACVRACPHDALHRVDFPDLLTLTERRDPQS